MKCIRFCFVAALLALAPTIARAQTPAAISTTPIGALAAGREDMR